MTFLLQLPSLLVKLPLGGQRTVESLGNQEILDCTIIGFVFQSRVCERCPFAKRERSLFGKTRVLRRKGWLYARLAILPSAILKYLSLTDIEDRTGSSYGPGFFHCEHGPRIRKNKAPRLTVRTEKTIRSLRKLIQLESTPRRHYFSRVNSYCSL